MSFLLTKKFRSACRNFPSLMLTHLSYILVLFLWISANIALFIAQFLHYHRSASFFYLRILVSDGLSVSRAAALCLNFNCALILLPVCRNVLSLFRFVCPYCFIPSSIRRRLMRLFDHHIQFHRCVGYAICFWTFVHVSAHIRNYERLIDVHNEHGSLAAALNAIFLRLPDVQINPFNKIDANMLGIRAMLSTTAGWTGVILVVCLLVMFTSSTVLIRRSFYSIFWFVHHLFIVFFICLILHGTQGIIREQINLNEHVPTWCAERYQEWNLDQQCLKHPKFRSLSPTSWIWLCGPLILYFIERLIRLVRSLQKVNIVDVIRHQSNVIEVRFQKKSMITPQPGQYVCFKFYSWTSLEWHPFTVTSGPEEPFVSVHIRVVGDWTRELSERLKDFPNNVPRLSVDGPYGSPADDVFDYNIAILIGAGIGVTPYTSILKHCRVSESKHKRLRRIYFYWICNTTACYEWFADMLKEVERELRDREITLTLKIYLTQWSISEVPSILQNHHEERDIYTGLEAKTFYGRPHFHLDFQAIVNENITNKDRQSVGVFLCGPVPLVNQLRRLCMKMNERSVSRGKLRFYLNKENF